MDIVCWTYLVEILCSSSQESSARLPIEIHIISSDVVLIYSYLLRYKALSENRPSPKSHGVEIDVLTNIVIDWGLYIRPIFGYTHISDFSLYINSFPVYPPDIPRFTVILDGLKTSPIISILLH